MKLDEKDDEYVICDGDGYSLLPFGFCAAEIAAAAQEIADRRGVSVWYSLAQFGSESTEVRPRQ